MQTKSFLNVEFKVYALKNITTYKRLLHTEKQPLFFPFVRVHSQHGQPASLTSPDSKYFIFCKFPCEFTEITNTILKLLAYVSFAFFPKNHLKLVLGKQPSSPRWISTI